MSLGPTTSVSDYQTVSISIAQLDSSQLVVIHSLK